MKTTYSGKWLLNCQVIPPISNFGSRSSKCHLNNQLYMNRRKRSKWTYIITSRFVTISSTFLTVVQQMCVIFPKCMVSLKRRQTRIVNSLWHQSANRLTWLQIKVRNHYHRHICWFVCLFVSQKYDIHGLMFSHFCGGLSLWKHRIG